MTTDELDEILLHTFDDRRLSRSERKALTAVFADHRDRPDRASLFRQRAFEIARRQLPGSREVEVLDWLEEVVKALDQAFGAAAPPTLAEAHFSPGDECRRRIISLIDLSRRFADICVFTITDNRIARALLEAHHRGVRVRIITDDEKSLDRGSDVEELARAGIEVRVDRSEHHMHHKFALFDASFILAGSYNWTLSAAELNEENVIVSNDPRLLARFQATFEALWAKFAVAAALV